MRISGPLACARCERPLEAEHVDLQTARASCMTCGRFFVVDPGTTIVCARGAVVATIETVVTETATTWSHRPPRPTAIVGIASGSGLALMFGALAVAAFALDASMLWPAGLVFAATTLAFVAVVHTCGTTLRTCTALTVDATSIDVHAMPRAARTTIPRVEAVAVDAFRQRGSWSVRVIGRDRRATTLVEGITEDEASYLAAELGRALVRAEPVTADA